MKCSWEVTWPKVPTGHFHDSAFRFCTKSSSEEKQLPEPFTSNEVRISIATWDSGIDWLGENSLSPPGL